MRSNWVRASSSTGGSGNLALTAIAGWRSPAAAFADSTLFEYTIREEDAQGVPVRCETGLGRISGGALVRVLPLTTWVVSTGIYDDTTPAALSFGATNVFVECTATASSGAMFAGSLQNTTLNASGLFSAAHNTWSDYVGILDRILVGPFWLGTMRPLTQIGVWCTQAGSAGAAASVALAQIGVDGMPDRVVAAANNLSLTATGARMATLSGGRSLAPGWYWQMVLTHGWTTTAPRLRSMDDRATLGSMLGTQGNGGMNGFNIDVTSGSRTFTEGAVYSANFTSALGSQIVNNLIYALFARDH